LSADRYGRSSRAILRQGIETHGGQVFKTAGDAFFAAFTTPWLALDAALAVQQALQAEAWSPQSPIRGRERAYAQRDPGLTDMKVNPRLRSLHADPRWHTFLRKRGFTD
jgi:hypothetical protein